MNSLFERNRLRFKDYGPVNDCSVTYVSRMIQRETTNIPSKCASQQKFIPFFRERDAIGRLLTTESIVFPVKSQKSSYIFPLRLKSKKKTLQPLPKAKPYQGSVPPIGHYNIETPWIHRSFSQKKLQKHYLIPNSSEKTLPDTQRPIPIITPKIATKKRINHSVPARKKGVWEDVAIASTPEQLRNILSFKSELKEIISCQLHISKSIEKLKHEYNL